MTTLRIAFTSCFSTEIFDDSQPVWDDIAQQEPDVLVLLGDSIYIDCPAPKGPDGSPVHPGQLSAFEFATHVHRLYEKQLAIPEFRALLQRPNLHTFAQWDDHDFLWNDALRPNEAVHLQHAIYSSNLFQCWQQALSGESAFPASVLEDVRVNKNIGQPVNYDDAMPGYRWVQLQANGVVLHLTDGRTWRDHSTLLGAKQRAQIEDVLYDQPEALHLIASGSTVNGKGVSGWKGFPEDHKWLHRMASQFNVVVLSGDIHRNEHPKPVQCGSRWLREFTASGAAVDFAPSFLSGIPIVRKRLRFERHFGLLTLNQGQLVKASLFDYETGELRKTDC